MEHLMFHLPYEARVGGDRCNTGGCTPFKGFLRELKKKMKNKEHVEASILEAYIVKEIGRFTSQYFEPDEQSKPSMPRRNNECTNSNDGFHVSIFNYPGKASGATKKGWLSRPKRHIVETYILTNYEVVTPYYESCLDELYQHHHLVDPIIDRFVSTEFKDWFKRRARRVVDDSKWTETVAYQPEEVVPVPIVAVDNQLYDLRDPNSLQVVLAAASTSRRQLHENDDDNEDEDEDKDSGRDDETDDKQ
ncbi:UNVERIFIED_CONTAM: hypothetical protein Sradi_2514500 [Sesamum radiatum]|uniref:DUF4218 domain-containing protein n=1 Tax=Sesamum radiatum TaxID=300843 RepID=A0AAW2SLI0_SESRA